MRVEGRGARVSIMAIIVDWAYRKIGLLLG
jgi:hypothetical protein